MHVRAHLVATAVAPSLSRFSSQEPLLPAESLPFPSQFIMGDHVDQRGNARLDVLLNTIDLTGGMVANRFAPHLPLVTRSIDRLTIHGEAPRFSYLTSHGHVVGSGKRSLSLKVCLSAYPLKPTEVSARTQLPLGHLVATSYLRFAIRGDQSLSMPVWKPETPDEQQESLLTDTRSKNAQTESRLLEALPVGESLRLRPRLLNTGPKTLRFVPTEADVNHHGIVFGGRTLSLLTRSAQEAAQDWLKAPLQLLRMDRMSFDRPGLLSHTLMAVSDVVRVTEDHKLQVQVDVWSVPRGLGQWLLRCFKSASAKPVEAIASALLTFAPVQDLSRLKPLLVHGPMARARRDVAEIRSRVAQADSEGLTIPG